MNKVLTGIRPTGPLHLGHYIGALKNWTKLQNENYECFFLVADIQALTTHADKPEVIEDSVREVILDFFGIGLDPDKDNVNFVLQSAIPELTELTVYLSMVTPFSWMQSNPTIQTEMKNLSSVSTGFMYYPVSQAADILFVSPDPRTDNSKILVPVGEDQVPHIRDTNKIVNAFNKTYSSSFVECDALVGDVGRLVGTDGNAKMSKSLGNAIYLKEESESVRKKIMSMYTDPNRIHPDDPGTVEGNPVFMYHDAFNENKEEVSDLKKRYREGKVGDVEVKEKLYLAIEEFLNPIRNRRKEAEKKDIWKYVEDGTSKARSLAKETIERTRKAIHLDYSTLKE